MAVHGNSVIATLEKLAKTDMDALMAYDHAFAYTDEPEVRDLIESFRLDHDRHVDALRKALAGQSGIPPRIPRDFKGFFIEGMTAIMSRIGARPTLLSLLGNEKITHAIYEHATHQEDLPIEIRALLMNHLDDEKRHLEGIRLLLKEKFALHTGEEGMEAS